MQLAATTIIGYVATATFLFWYIPFITRHRESMVWLPSRFVSFLFGDSTIATVIAVIVQVLVPAAVVCWLAVSVLHILFPQ